MWKFLGAGLLIIAVAVFGFSLIDGSGGDVNASTIITLSNDNMQDYARAYEAREWDFPRDHGSHDDYQVEWWYYTGNLAGENGRHFGFQFTIFRRAVHPQLPESDSEWRTNQIYMAHFSLSDIENGDFYHDERYSRGSAGLAGSLPNNLSTDESYRVWLENWEASALNDDATQQRIVAQSYTFGIDFTLEQDNPVVLQGVDGFSQKNEERGTASHYYSLTRMLTEGTIRIGDETFRITGTSWMDHEFSTSSLSDNTQGWDWFAMQFDDGRELVLGHVRLTDGNISTAYTGTMIYEDNTQQLLDFDQYDIQVTDTWESPHTGAVYPAGWIVTIDAEIIGADEDLEIIVTPLMADQELNSGDISYWEGAVELSGDITGYGYVELTGYGDEAIAGRF